MMWMNKKKWLYHTYGIFIDFPNSDLLKAKGYEKWK